MAAPTALWSSLKLELFSKNNTPLLCAFICFSLAFFCVRCIKQPPRHQSTVKRPDLTRRFTVSNYKRQKQNHLEPPLRSYRHFTLEEAIFQIVAHHVSGSEEQTGRLIELDFIHHSIVLHYSFVKFSNLISQEVLKHYGVQVLLWWIFL